MTYPAYEKGPWTLPLAPIDRLASDARAYAQRTDCARQSADGRIRSKQRKLLADSWYTYGLRLIEQRKLVKTTVKGCVRYMPPTLDDLREWDREAKQKRQAPYRHAAHRG